MQPPGLCYGTLRLLTCLLSPSIDFFYFYPFFLFSIHPRPPQVLSSTLILHQNNMDIYIYDHLGVTSVLIAIENHHGSTARTFLQRPDLDLEGSRLCSSLLSIIHHGRLDIYIYASVSACMYIIHMVIQTVYSTGHDRTEQANCYSNRDDDDGDGDDDDDQSIRCTFDVSQDITSSLRKEDTWSMRSASGC